MFPRDDKTDDHKRLPEEQIAPVNDGPAEFQDIQLDVEHGGDANRTEDFHVDATK